MNHYFTNEPVKKVQHHQVKFVFEHQSFTLQSAAGIFSSTRLDPGTEILIETLLKESLHGDVLDLGCGYGAIGVTLGKLRPTLKVSMSDVKEAALMLAQENIRLHHLPSVKTYQSNGFETIQDQFDTIILNPPIRAGKKVMYHLYQQSYEHLREGGTFYIVIRKDLGALSSEKELHKQFKTVERLARHHGYHVYRAKK